MGQILINVANLRARNMTADDIILEQTELYLMFADMVYIAFFGGLR